MTNLQKIQVVILLASISSCVFAQGTWTNLPDFPGSSRFAATSFSIGSIVYYATGAERNTNTDKNDLWAYDVNTRQWIEKQNMGTAPGRMMAASFALNGKGYVGTGKINSGGSFSTVATFANDFYKYDPSANSWTQLNNIGPTGRLGAVGFAANGKGYIALGSTSGGTWSNIGASTKTIFEFDPVNETWIERSYPANFPGLVSASSFVLNGKAYIAGGFRPAFEAGGSNGQQGFFSLGTYEFDPSTFVWTPKAFMPFSTHIAASFSSFDRGYIVGGVLASSSQLVWDFNPISKAILKYNPNSNQWTTLSTFAPQFMTHNAATSNCENGFISTGSFRSAAESRNDLANYQFSPTIDNDYIQANSTAVCSNADSQFILRLSAAGTVTWSTSTNIFITSGQGTKTISVGSNANGSGWVQASINLGCRVVTFPQFPTWVGAPPADNGTLIWTTIRGENPVTVGPGSFVSYQADNVPYATSYTWTLPRGFVPYGGSTTTASPYLSATTGNQTGTFTMLCRANNACGSSYTRSLTINVTGGGGGGIQLRAAFPNPANEAITVKTKEEDSKEEVEVALFNKSFEKVFFVRTEEKEIMISTANLPSGTYYLNVRLGNEVTQKQVIVSH